MIAAETAATIVLTERQTGDPVDFKFPDPLYQVVGEAGLEGFVLDGVVPVSYGFLFEKNKFFLIFDSNITINDL